MAGRGIVYMVWGGEADGPALKRSLASVAAVHPDLPVHVERLPDGATLLDKATMLDVTPFEETLFLDADTVVLDRLDFGFAKAGQAGLACSICECPWARRYGGLQGEMVEYNTGVLFFTAVAKPLFDTWKRLAGAVDSSIIWENQDGRLSRMPLNDQAGFALAMEETGFRPFVLPHNWNFRPRWHKSWFGPIKIWHDYAEVPEGLLAFNRQQASHGVPVRFATLTG